MAQPTITKIIHHWKMGENQRFHVIGTDFDQNATVTLQDDRADWNSATVESVSANGKHLIFVSQPSKIKAAAKGERIDSSGALTITITNPTSGLSANQDVEGTYEK
jgi:hypothetical protein